MPDQARAFLARQHPYDGLPRERLDALAQGTVWTDAAAGETVFRAGDLLRGIYVIAEGEIVIRDESGSTLSHLGPGNSFGERGLMKEGTAVTTAEARTATRLLMIPAAVFRDLWETVPEVRRFFDRRRDRRGPGDDRPADLTTIRVAELMAPSPVIVAAQTSLSDAARTMRDRRISSLCVGEGDRLDGIVTIRDLTNKAMAEGLSLDTPVSAIMTRAPVTLSSAAIGSDVLHAMVERGIGHLPIVDAGKLVGIVTQTDLTRFQASTSAGLVADIAKSASVGDLAKATGQIPQLLVQLVGSGNRHEVTTRLITDIADAATRRLLALAEAEFGPPPVPYLWLACGSQGRQEQTGVSDQDNCLILSDDFRPEHDAYFAGLAHFVADGLDAAGYVYCPGEMMATTPRWRQPLRVWREYFKGWIATPSNEAQMLASVMFDLRPIGGETALFESLQTETLAAASGNSIFTAHMVANSLKHNPPLGLLRGIATVRSGEHRNTVDLKMNGVVPIVDLGRMYALKGRLTQINTRARLEAAGAAGIISASGARDLIDAYDLIAETRLEHQARQIKAGGRPDNYMPPSVLSDFERSHLRDAFVVVKTMQSALSSGAGGGVMG